MEQKKKGGWAQLCSEWQGLSVNVDSNMLSQGACPCRGQHHSSERLGVQMYADEPGMVALTYNHITLDARARRT